MGSRAPIRVQVSVELFAQPQRTALCRAARDLLRHDGHRAAAWPARAKKPPLMPRLEVFPLERLGAAQGYSGSRVAVARFRAARGGPSLLQVIKVDTAEKAQGEFKRAERVRGAVTSQAPGDVIAWPYLCCPNGKLSVLWQPFVGNEKGNDADAIKITSVWDRLSSEPASIAEIGSALKTVYSAWRDLHLHGVAEKGGQSGAVALGKEYAKEGLDYFRGMDADRTARLFPPLGKERRLGDVLTAVRALKLPLILGAVHGDLHPRNIVFTSLGHPKVIDLGWADRCGHVVKDYALMECNLRFMALAADVPREEIDALASWVRDAEVKRGIPSAIRHPSCRRNARLIQVVRACWRELADEVGGEGDRELEYAAGMFIIGFGLLKHLRHAENQRSAIASLTYQASGLDAALRSAEGA